MDATITFTVNGKSRTVTTDPQRPLLDVLREDLQLTGTKYGCGEGQCRACSVLMNGKSIASCTTPVSDADKKSILTIEGLTKDGKLHPVQESFLDEGAFQCGYCTAGMIMGTVALLSEIAKPTDADIVSHMNRHICRCCSYTKYMQAIHRAAAQAQKEVA
jgi:aerobic-type carbon monoxide dehydrogenase small subunit (CoxS/CutS family)